MKTTPQLRGGSLCRPRFSPWDPLSQQSHRAPGIRVEMLASSFPFQTPNPGYRGVLPSAASAARRTLGAGDPRGAPAPCPSQCSSRCRAHHADQCTSSCFSTEAPQPGRPPCPLLPRVGVPSASPVSRRPRWRSRPLSFCLAGKELFLASASVIWHLNVTRALVANIYSSKIFKFQGL